MHRPGFNILAVLGIILFFGFNSAIAADDSNKNLSSITEIPTEKTIEPPPNYTVIDTNYFEGAPPFNQMSEDEVGGYYLYYDRATARWTICSVVVPGGQVFEQMHGSVVIRMDAPPAEGINVWTQGYTISDDLTKNDRWGWVKWPDSLGSDLYELWWDFTVDYPRLDKSGDVYDTVGLSFTGCVEDFNVWASGHFTPFDASQLLVGQKMMPVSSIPNFVDGVPGVDDPYQNNIAASDPNTSVFTAEKLPGKAYNSRGEIISGDTYGDKFGGSAAYAGNGVQFSISACDFVSMFPPTFNPPLGYTEPRMMCPGGTIEDTIRAIDVDEGDSVTISIISGPGSITTTPDNPAVAYYNFTPGAPGDYTVVFEARDLADSVAVDSVTYVVNYNAPPILEVADTTIDNCFAIDPACLTLSATDPENDPLTYSMISGPGTLDPISGELCFTPNGEGQFDFEVEVSDSCGADTASFTVTVTLNHDPAIIPFDTSVYICAGDTVCFDVHATDPDIGDSLEIRWISGPGEFTQTGNGIATQCFLPDDVDSATYVFHYSVTDECWRLFTYNKDLASPPPPPEDSIIITVFVDDPPVITCPPENIVLNLCQPDTVCTNIDFQPSDAVISVIGDGATFENGQLCFYAEETATYSYSIIAATECAADTCEVVFDVTVGQPPVISCPDGVQNYNLCAPDSICIDVPVDDPNATVEVLESGGVYHDGQLCFYAEQGGPYTFTVVATGECGSDTCVVDFDVTMGEPPAIVCPDTLEQNFCDTFAEICVPLDYSPADANVSIISGSADLQNGQLCFTPDHAGIYTFGLVVSNDCGADTCEINVKVGFDETPVLTCPTEPITADLCAPELVCAPISVTPADAVLEVVGGGATIENGQLCFTPATGGQYSFTVAATTSCGTDQCTIDFDIIIGTPPAITCPTEPFSYDLCAPTEICIPIEISPADAVTEILEAGASYVNGELCFYADENKTYQYTLVAANDCGADTCLVTIDISLNTPPAITCPSEPFTVNLCAPDQVCREIAYLPANASVHVVEPEASFSNGQICFNADQTGIYNFTIVASNECGDDTCFVSFDVTVGAPPQITCPTEDINVNLCAPQEICTDVAVIPTDAVVTILEGGATYINGQLCFYADQSGTFTYTMVAANDCGEDTCQVVFNVDIGTPPSITCPDGVQEYHLCEPQEICLDIPIEATDATVTVLEDGGSYVDGQLCFFADTPGSYSFTVVASGTCGDDTCTVDFDVTFDQPPTVSIPDTSEVQCEYDQICLPVTYSDPEGVITNIQVIPDIYQMVNDTICVLPDAPGSYQVIVIVTDGCGQTAADTADIEVTLNQPPTVAVGDSTLFDCDAVEVCLPVDFSDVDGVVDSIAVSEPAVYDDVNHAVCLTVDTSGEYNITVTVFDDCRASASDIGTITFTRNSPPVVTLENVPTQVYYCELQEVCIDVAATDVDDNLFSVRAEGDCGDFVYDETAGTICWTPLQFGVCEFAVIATDVCGAADTALVSIEVIPTDQPNPSCPNDTTIYACVPKEVCYELGVPPDGHYYSVSPDTLNFNPQTGRLCMIIAADHTDTITVKDSTQCGVGTCSFVIISVMNQPPVITAIDEFDTAFCHSAELCFDVTISDPEGNIDSVTFLGDCPDAVYDAINQKVCMTVTEAVNCVLTIRAVDECGVYTDHDIAINATPNQPPQLHLPTLQTFVRCVDDSSDIVIPNFCVTDPDYDYVSLTLDSGLGQFSFSDITACGTLTFRPPDNDSAQYCFKFRYSDACDTLYEDYCINVLPATVCSTCVNVAIDGGSCVNTSGTASVKIIGDATNQMAGFDFLLAYDGTALNFITARLGAAISSWEYFTYRLGTESDCQGSCPSGLLRLVSIADVNNGAHHPPEEQLTPSGVIATIDFRVSSDLNLGGQYVPIKFFWFDCGDNTASDPSGQYLYMDYIVMDPEGNIIWDEMNDDVYPESNRLDNVGAPDECLVGNKEAPVRCISFHNGGVCITHPDSVDARGDMNLNGVAYEIADAIVYTNFFISGISAFHISVPGQTAASDVNADGQTLSVADLVYLIRIIIGDAPPYPKLSTDANPATINYQGVGGITDVTLDSPNRVGAALLIFDGGSSRATPELTELAGEVEMKYGRLDGQLRVLLYSFDPSGFIPAGEVGLLRIVDTDGAPLRLASVEMADAYANEMAVKISSNALPDHLELSQNRPNPFNPTTTFSMSMPAAGEYSLTIYNVAGQVVRQWKGHAEAGIIQFTWDGTDDKGAKQASGIYLYRADAIGQSAIKKMVLLK